MNSSGTENCFIFLEEGYSVQFSCSVVSDFLWPHARQASLSITNSQSLLKFMSIKSVMPSNHLILCHPLLFMLSILASIRVFPNESVLHSDGQSIGVSTSASILPMNIQGWFPLGFTCCPLLSKGLSSIDIDSIFKSRDITLPTKVLLVKAMVFAEVMCGCESWTIKKAERQRIGAFERWCWRRLLRVPYCKEIQPVHPKGDQSWVFIGGTGVEAETPIFCPPDAKSWLIWKDPDAGKDWRQEEKGTTEDEMVGWHHGLNGHVFE